MNSAERQKVINTHHNLTFRVLGLIRIFNDSISKIRKILYLALLEPLPYTIVESILLGTIPIASRVGGVPEIVEGTPAEEYTFTPGDAGELLDRVEKLISQPRDAIVDAGMKLREHALRLFNMEEITGAFVNLFESLVSQSS